MCLAYFPISVSGSSTMMITVVWQIFPKALVFLIISLKVCHFSFGFSKFTKKTKLSLLPEKSNEPNNFYQDRCDQKVGHFFFFYCIKYFSGPLLLFSWVPFAINYWCLIHNYSYFSVPLPPNFSYRKLSWVLLSSKKKASLRLYLFLAFV